MDQIMFAPAAVDIPVLPSVVARVDSLRAFGHEVMGVPAHAAHHDDGPLFGGIRDRWEAGRDGAAPADGTRTLTTELTLALDQQEETT